MATHGSAEVKPFQDYYDSCCAPWLSDNSRSKLRNCLPSNNEGPDKENSIAERSAASSWTPAGPEGRDSYVPLCDGGSTLQGNLSRRDYPFSESLSPTDGITRAAFSSHEPRPSRAIR